MIQAGRFGGALTRLVIGASVATAVIAGAACAKEEKAAKPEFEAGVCINDAEDVAVVACDSPQADRMLVYARMIEAIPKPCTDGLKVVSIANIYEGRQLGPATDWCTVDPDKVTPEIQARIDRSNSSG